LTYLFHIFSYVTARGQTLIDRELYLPLDLCEDQDRCRVAHIPEPVHLQTKPELAIQMLGRMQEVGCPIAWVVADTALRRQPGSARLSGSALVFLGASGGLREETLGS
jgi:SRSO17 transposase